MSHLALGTHRLILYLLKRRRSVINHNLLQKEGSLVRDERCANLWYKDKKIVGSLLLCLFSIRFPHDIASHGFLAQLMVPDTSSIV